MRPYWLFETLSSIWHPFGGHLRPYLLFETLFRIWHPFHSTFETFRYLRNFSAFETLFIQHLRPYWLFETLFSIWHPFGGHLRLYSLFETLFSIWHPFHSTFETLFVIWGPFQHLRPFSFNIWDLIGYLTPFSAFNTLLEDSAADILTNFWTALRYCLFCGCSSGVSNLGSVVSQFCTKGLNCLFLIIIVLISSVGKIINWVGNFGQWAGLIYWVGK